MVDSRDAMGGGRNNNTKTESQKSHIAMHICSRLPTTLHNSIKHKLYSMFSLNHIHTYYILLSA